MMGMKKKSNHMKCTHGRCILQHFESELDKFRKQKKVCVCVCVCAVKGRAQSAEE